ncbi:MAG TPA: thiamine pyrophosphate-dependent enzyme [Alphaproteobacteria bacterium]
MAAEFIPQFAPRDKPVAPFSMLGANGRLKRGAEPELDDRATLEALRLMMLGRMFDQKCLSLQRQGRLSTFAPIFGQEATLAGTAMAMDPARDWAVPQYREAPVQIRQGLPLATLALFRRGHPDGGVIPAGVNVLATQVSLAAQLPHAVGLAWGIRMKGGDGVVVVFFGDGASSEGDFHESCNLAGLVDAPVIFLLQNNQWAISTPRAIQSAARDLAARAPGYGFAGVSVDGNDLLAMHKVAADAVRRARAGGGPTLIEAHTYRIGMHTTADDPSRYVDAGELERWKKRDPIERVQRYLAAKGKWDDARAAAWEDEIRAEIEAAFDHADGYPPPRPEQIYEHLYAEPTPTLIRQRRANLGQP